MEPRCAWYRNVESRLAMRFWACLALTLLMTACGKETPPMVAECKDPTSGCRLDEHLSVKFSETPAIMRKFGLDVMAPADAAPYASFQMRGMDMGMNRYRLLWDGSKWHAEIILPACIQGRRDWVLRLESGGRVYEMPFTSR